MRKGTWLIIGAFLLGLFHCDALDPEDTALPLAAVAAQIAPAETADLGTAIDIKGAT